jgi:hypothetical protein
LKFADFLTQGRNVAKAQGSEKCIVVPLRLGLKLALSVVVLAILAACNTAGELPQGPVTPIVPPTGAAATRTVQPMSTPVAGTTSVPTQPTAPVALPTGPASIVGTLVNGTAGASSPAHQPLTLYALTQDGSSILFTRTITSDADGQFVFDQLDPSPTTLYAIQTQYLKAYYTSDALTFAHGGVTLTAPITVYETTTDAAGVSVEQMHMFFDFAPGSTTVGQLFIVSNSGDRAYIGADGISLHLPLPPGATNVHFQDGELGGRYQSTPDGFADTEAVAPGVGTAQILVSCDLPYDGKKLDVNLPTAYPVKSVNVLVPDPGPKLTSSQLTFAGSRQTQVGNMQNYVGGNLAAGANLALQISGAANTTTTGRIPSGSTSPPWILIASAALLLAAAGIVAFVWLRQQREAAEEQGQDPAAQREELLDAIAELDDDFEAGRVAEVDYRQQRTELKAELVELMKTDE